MGLGPLGSRSEAVIGVSGRPLGARNGGCGGRPDRCLGAEPAKGEPGNTRGLFGLSIGWHMDQTLNGVWARGCQKPCGCDLSLWGQGIQYRGESG